MVPRFLAEFAEGSRVEAPFVLRSKSLKYTRTGETYLSLELADKTGSMPAVYFRPARLALDIPVGTVVMVTGTVTVYRGVRRVSVESVCGAEDWDAGDFIAVGSRPASELTSEFGALLRSVTDRELRGMLRAVFGDKDFFARFCECPGSQSYHHAHVGGLLEHTVSVADQCAHVAARQSELDRDLVVTAALLHDVGKVEELVFDVGVGYTDAGRLLGHVVLGVQMVHSAASRAKIHPEKLVRLEHAVLSHHGELEWGSPKRPSTLEALVLHHADNLDAKAAGFADALSGAALADERWTDAHNLFRRPLYAPRPLDDEQGVPIAEDEQHFRLTA